MEGVARTGSGYLVRGAIGQTQRGQPYHLEVPVVVQTDTGSTTHAVRLADRTAALEIEVPDRPLMLHVDPYFDVSWYWREFGLAYLLLGRVAEALGMLDHLSTRHYRVAAYKAACHALLGNMDQARDCVAECLALKPDFSVRHYMTKDPFKDPDHAERLANAMLLAGLPG